MTCNPYEDESCETSPPQVNVNVDGVVCAFKYHDNNCNDYEMVTYTSEDEAVEDGSVVSHLGACGLCSTAVDLAVYMSIPDMVSY